MHECEGQGTLPDLHGLVPLGYGVKVRVADLVTWASIPEIVTDVLLVTLE